MAFLGAMEAMVKIKELTTRAEVEIRKCAEEHQTERCRIYAGMAGVEEQGKLEAMTLQQNTQRRQDVMAHQQEMARIDKVVPQSGYSGGGILHWLCTAVLGLYSLSGRRPELMLVPHPQAVAGASVATTVRVVRQRGLLPRIFPALLAVLLVRFFWLNTWARSMLHIGTGPFSVERLQKLLRDALRLLKHTQATPQGDMASSYAMVQRQQSQTLELGTLAIKAPEQQPDAWVTRQGPNGRTFFHHKALGPAPWDLENSPFVKGQCPWPASMRSMTCASMSSSNIPRSRSRSGSFQFNMAMSSAAAAASNGGNYALWSREGKDQQLLTSLLANWGLGTYAEELAQLGYNAETLRSLPRDKADSMLQQIGCKPEHRDLFLKAMDSWR